MLTALSGPVTVIGDPLNRGIKVFFASLNARGGIAGRYQVELVTEDTRYEAPATVQKYQKIKDQVVMFGQILGTAAVNAVLPQLKADNVVAVPASLDERWIPELNLLPTNAPYQIQFLNGANYYVNEMGGRGHTMCALAVEGPYGDAGLRGASAAGGAEGFTLASTARFRQVETDFTAQITQLADAGCQAVFVTGLPEHMRLVLGTAVRLDFHPVWLGQHPTWEPGLAEVEELRPAVEQDYLLLAEGTEWGDESVPGMKRMMEDVRRFAPGQKPHPTFTGGYIEAWATAALLEKAVALGDLSRHGLLEAQRQLGVVSFGGLTGDYTYGPPEQRNPARTTTVYRVNRAKPGFLEAVKKGFTSPGAQGFRFEP